MSDRDAAPRRLPLSHRKAFVARHTRLRPVEGVQDVRLHLADDVEPLWHAVEAATGEDGAPIPFWAFAWAGGLALAAWVQANPSAVAGRHVLDMATGSGLVGIVAARAGAAEVDAADIDPFAEAAVALNERANRVNLSFVRRDLLDEPPPGVDVILAADTWYEGPLAVRMLPWLRAAADAGITVLVGDPGRTYLPDPDTIGFERVWSTDVHTTTTLEDRAVVTASVFRVRGGGPRDR